MWSCGSITFGVCAWPRHAHTPNVMLPHHHIWPFAFLNFKFSDLNKEPNELPEDDLNNIDTCWSVLSVLILTFQTNIIVYRSALVGT